MKLRILGATGTQCRGAHSMSALVNESLLLDAGTGAFNLGMEEINGIADALITHSHLDHTAMLCFLAETRIGGPDGHGLRVRCLPDTAEAIRRGFLNGEIWPDFENLHLNGQALMSFAPFAPFEKLEIGGASITPFPVEHEVPTVGFCLHGERENFVFIADIFEMPEATCAYLNGLSNFRRMTVEVSFPEGSEKTAAVSGHLTPKTLEALLAKLPSEVEVFYCHMKPRYQDEIMEQMQKRFGDRARPLQSEMVFDI